jgi:hypothetical protein
MVSEPATDLLFVNAITPYLLEVLVDDEATWL